MEAHVVVPQDTVTEQALAVSVQLKEPGLVFLRAQLDIDIQSRARFWNPNGFTFLQLLEMDRLLTRHADMEPVLAGDNILLTNPQCDLLATYTDRYHVRAIENDDVLRRHAFADALNAFTIQATPIPTSTEPLVVTHDHGLPASARPLAQLWDRVCAFFGGHSRTEQFETAFPAL